MMVTENWPPDPMDGYITEVYVMCRCGRSYPVPTSPALRREAHRIYNAMTQAERAAAAKYSRENSQECTCGNDAVKNRKKTAIDTEEKL